MKPIDYYNKEIMSRYKPKTTLEHRENIVIEVIHHLKLENDASIIDVGCGDGYFLSRLNQTMPGHIHYYGVDYSVDQINVAKNKHSFHFNTCNLEEGIPFPDKTFNLLYAGEVIEHLYNPDYFLTEAFRVLKEKGYLLLSTPNLNSWINRLLFLFGYQPLFVECSTKSSLYGYGFMRRFKKQTWPVGHLRVFNRLSLTDILKDNGFEVISCKGAIFEFMPKPLKLTDRCFSAIPGLASDLVVLALKST